jgi:hypothetical protein
MLHMRKVAVCSEINTKHINTVCWQNVQFLSVKRLVHQVPADSKSLRKKQIRPLGCRKCKQDGGVF